MLNLTSKKYYLLIKVICLSLKKKVESERGRALAEQNGLLFFETSAKTGENVALSF